MAHEPMGYSDISSISQELISREIQAVLKEEAQFLPTITDYSGRVAQGADSVRIPRIGELAAANKVENTDTEAQILSVTSDLMNLDKHKQILVEIEDKARVQAMINLEAEVIKEQAREMALQIDRDILTELKAVSTSTPDHLLDYADDVANSTTTDIITLADIVEARRLLRNQKFMFRDDNYFLLLSPKKEAEMLSISNFLKANEYGAGSAPLLNGEIGRVYGFRVLVSSLLADDECLMYHKSHVGFAFQNQFKFERDRNLRNLSDQLSVQALYGVETLRGGVGGVFFNGTGNP